MLHHSIVLLLHVFFLLFAEKKRFTTIYNANVVETLGGWDSDAVFHLRAIAKRSAARAPLQAESASRHLFQRLSILLQRANAGLIASRAPPLPHPHVLGL